MENAVYFIDLRADGRASLGLIFFQLVFCAYNSPNLNKGWPDPSWAVSCSNYCAGPIIRQIMIICWLIGFEYNSIINYLVVCYT